MKTQTYQNIIIRRFIKKAIKELKRKRINTLQQRTIIDSDIVPRVKGTRNRIQAPIRTTQKNTTPPMKGAGPITIQQQTTPTQLSIEQQPLPTQLSIEQQPLPTPPLPPRTPPLLEQHNKEPYGKITMILKDPSVTTIECPGPGAQLRIYRGRERQLTRFSLNKEEIEQILNTFSEETHIPLLEGVFRTMSEEWNVTAIISQQIGSKFIIKKNLGETAW